MQVVIEEKTPGQQLEGKLFLGLAPGACPVAGGNPAVVIAAGPLSKQPGTVANRVVLVKVESAAQIAGHRYNRFVVYNEFFPNYPDVSASHYDSGRYFRDEDLVDATKAFAERVAVQANYLASLYRDEAA
jgi:hypothetical protein